MTRYAALMAEAVNQGAAVNSQDSASHGDLDVRGVTQKSVRQSVFTFIVVSLGHVTSQRECAIMEKLDFDNYSCYRESSCMYGILCRIK